MTLVLIKNKKVESVSLNLNSWSQKIVNAAELVETQKSTQT